MMTPPPRPPVDPAPQDENFGSLLHHVRAGLIRRLESDLAAQGFDLNFSQFRVLKYINARGAITPSELARCVDHDAGAMTRLLDRLQEKGYLHRVPRADDRRVVDITLTEAGRAIWGAINGCGERLLADALSDLSAAEQQQLFALLERVRQTLDQRLA